MSIALRRAALAPILFALLVLATGATSVSAASPATVISAPAALVRAVGFSAYLDHDIAYLDQAGEDSDEIIFQLDFGTDAQIARAYLTARNHVRAEVRWMATHRPASSCFAKLYAADKVTAHFKDLAYSTLYTFWHNGARNSSLSTRGIRYLDMATAKTKAATRILDNTHC